MTLWHLLSELSRNSDPNKRRSTSTTPIADGKYRYSVFGSLIKLGLIIVIPIGLLKFYGQPALRIQYTWNGNDRAPIYSQCDYLTLLNGWRDVRPHRAINNCPLVVFFPFELNHLTGE